jgi:anti-repressor protein
MNLTLITPQAQFDFHGHPVRTQKDNRGNPWFVAADICNALEIKNSRDAIAKLDDDEKDVVSTDTLGGRQALAVVNEAGLYELIFRSRKAEAKAFKRWVKNDVLPALRKDGVYIVGEEKMSLEGMTSSEIQRYVDELTTKLTQAADAKVQRRKQEHQEEKLARSDAFRFLRRRQ